MKEIKAIIQPFMLGRVCDALQQIPDLPGLTVSEVMGWGKARAVEAKDPVQEGGYTFARKTKVEIVLPDELAETVARTIAEAAHTGNVGDGKTFVKEVDGVIKIRTSERGEAAI